MALFARHYLDAAAPVAPRVTAAPRPVVNTDTQNAELAALYAVVCDEEAIEG
jgi:hypothetical protein